MQQCRYNVFTPYIALFTFYALQLFTCCTHANDMSAVCHCFGVFFLSNYNVGHTLDCRTITQVEPFDACCVTKAEAAL